MSVRGSAFSSCMGIAPLPANATSYLDGGLRKNRSCRHRVRASNAVGNSVYSNVVGIRTLP